jgi:hypothetical protein
MEDYVISPALKAVELYSPEAARLILLTGYVESRYEYVAQVNGPARSFWQVEPTTALDHYENYIRHREPLRSQIDCFLTEDSTIRNELTMNMAFAVIMARLVYRRRPTPIPAIDDLKGQAHIWKKDYNTHLGAGSEEKFMEMCRGLRIE